MIRGKEEVPKEVKTNCQREGKLPSPALLGPLSRNGGVPPPPPVVTGHHVDIRARTFAEPEQCDRCRAQAGRRGRRQNVEKRYSEERVHFSRARSNRVCVRATAKNHDGGGARRVPYWERRARLRAVARTDTINTPPARDVFAKTRQTRNRSAVVARSLHRVRQNRRPFVKTTRTLFYFARTNTSYSDLGRGNAGRTGNKFDADLDVEPLFLVFQNDPFTTKPVSVNGTSHRCCRIIRTCIYLKNKIF